jgi:hypothetical protein
MSDTKHTNLSKSEATARRAFLKTAGKAAVTAPAVALLLAASTKPAAAQYRVERQESRERPLGYQR